jgi:hypothetical protein
MENCYNINLLSQSKEVLCPKCFQKGKKVKLITLKALLQPTALAKLDSKRNYDFCATQNCNVVYFTDKNSSEYISHQVKEGRCGCEVNNLQGGCCLGNVNTFIKTIAGE